jgi:NAD-dependent dihydropyrimidine dehydrogenase PreA subunit
MNHISMTSATCCGCKACALVCSKQAISFIADGEGFQIPVVDEGACVGCGLCTKACPALNSGASFGSADQLECYAFQYHDEVVRKNSASGALFPAFAKLFIETYHGYVCGCVLDAELTAKHIVSNNWHDVERMQDSKYVQSDMGTCIADVVCLLKNGEYVLFTGTSCQVNGLLSAVSAKRVSTDRLLTVDFFCHGVPSPMVWKDYVRLVEKRLRFKAEGFRFRNKTYGWGKGTQSRGTGYLNTWQHSGTQHEHAATIARIWRSIFFSNLCLRQYCHSCPYASVNKPADITMADFWGIETFHPEFDDHKGCSLAIVRNRKAQAWLNQLPDTELLSVSVEDSIWKQGNASAPSKPNPRRAEFWKDYASGGLAYVLPKYYYYTPIGRLKSFVKYILFKLHLRRYA